jgi:hypothetical protein
VKLTGRYLVRYTHDDTHLTVEALSLDDAEKLYGLLRTNPAVKAASVWQQTTMTWQAAA